MKQSTKLLSLVLALVMAFSCMTVIGNAALVKSEVTWDCIDDADLTAEQVADLALDLVDNDLLAGMETIDLSILGELRLNSINNIFTDITSLRDSIAWSIGSGLLGDLGDMDFDPLLQSGSYGLFSSHTAYQRSHGDLNVIYALLEFIGNDNNAGILSKIAHGLGTDSGISLGLIGNFLDLGSLGDDLADIPGMLKEMVYDMLIYGSYKEGYENDSYPSLEDLEAAGSALPTDMDTFDEMINNAILNLLINPQDYDWEGEGEAATKVWDMGSIILPGVKTWTEANGRDAAISYISPLTNSLFGILDILAQFAIDDIAINALNNNLKKALMLAVEADLNELDAAGLPAAVYEAFEVDDTDGLESYVTYLAYDKMAKSGNTWYYTTLESEVEEDPVTGEPVVDEEGNEVSKKVRKYFKVNMAVANEFANLINWDWEFVGSGVTPTENQTQLLYSNIVGDDGAIATGINDLLGLVYTTALTEEAQADFEAVTGAGWLEGNENINDNVVRVTKYILANFGDKVFGTESAYASYTYEELEPLTIVDMVALIGPEFFEDAMPQIILPKNADGTYAFHEGVQLWEFAAIVLRELITGIAPNVNYDAYIFENGDVTSANDRLFVEQDADAWFNILLNMGTDLAIEYLVNITNFRDFVAEKESSLDLDSYISTGGTDAAHWTKTLNHVILWCVDYVGNQGSTSVLDKLDYNTVAGYSDPFDKLSYILNTLLPLGFVNGYTSSEFDLDAGLLVEGIKAVLTDFDLTAILALFGRNTDSSRNILNEPLIPAVLEVVNSILSLVFRKTLLQSVDSGSVDTVVSAANLQTTVKNLLTGLYGSREAILLNALPVVGKLIKGWGTEQSFNEPQIALSRTIDLTNGATAAAVEVQVRNASDGVWRHYRDEAGTEYTDNQYQILLKEVKAYDNMAEGDSTSAYVTPTLVTTTNIDYGQSGTFTYTAAGVPAEGALVRFEVSYQVIDEDGNAMADGKIFTAKSYAWLNYNPTDEGTTIANNSQLLFTEIYTPKYVALSTAMDEIPEMECSYFGREYKLFTSNQTGKITNNTGTVDGLTFASLEQKFANSSGGRYLRGIKNFKTYTHTYVNEDGEDTSDTYAVTGSVDEAAWTAANKTSGSESRFSISLTDKDATETYDFVIKYYDDVYQQKLAQLAANEMDAMRLASDYNLSGTVYADKILTTANTTDDAGETVYRESNFSTTAWIDADENEYAEANVANIVEETNADGVVVGASGTVTVDGEKVSVKKVTKIDCATAINSYVAAFVPGIRGGMQEFNANTVYDFQARYEALYVSSNDVAYCKKTTEQVVAEGNAENIDAALETLKAELQTVEETYTYEYDFTDYKMYRLNRLNDVRDDIHSLIQLQDDQSPKTVDEIDEYFGYNWMEENDFRALVAGDANEAYLLALLEKFDDEEIKGKAEWLENVKLDYQTKTLLEVEMLSNLLERTSSRLLKREYGVIDTQLVDEIESANNMIGTDSSKYTEKSWARYQDALTHANNVVNANGEVKSQKNIFSAKYNLLVARKNLVPAGMEADYSELEALIAQAQMVMDNTGLYNNTAKEIGQVLAELGYNEIDEFQLFPGSALLVREEGYHVDDQDKVDRAADALKEALARLEFKNTSVTGNGVTVSESTLVEADEENGIEAVTATTTVIGERLDADAVKNLFTVTATDATVGIDQITVSNDLYYTIDTDLEGFAGTNAVVTFYTIQSGVKIPVATVRVIVNGDINGDGVVDALDGAYAALVEAEKTELQGCYLLAGDLSGNDREITSDDYGAIVNLVVD